MKIKSKIVAYLKLMYSFFVKGILIAGLAIATQNVMAIHPCNSHNCCGSWNDGTKSCKGNNGLKATCVAVQNSGGCDQYSEDHRKKWCKEHPDDTGNCGK